MLTNPTVDGLYTLNLPAMARGLVEQRERPDYQALSFEERLGLLVDLELLERENRRLQRALKTAKLRTNAVVEDIDFRRPRGLDRGQVLNLAESLWVANHHNVLVVGPTGAGKSFIACALAHSAIRHGHSALYLRGPRLLDDLVIARADGRLPRLLASWARVSVLVVDDFLLRPLNPDQAADLLEVIEDRSQVRSTIVTSQLPVAHWHEALGEPTVADAILDRLLQNAHRLELSGESLRRTDLAPNGDPRTVRDYRPTKKTKEVIVRG
jgi:DNA replication protein DnaC